MLIDTDDIKWRNEEIVDETGTAAKFMVAHKEDIDKMEDKSRNFLNMSDKEKVSLIFFILNSICHIYDAIDDIHDEVPMWRSSIKKLEQDKDRADSILWGSHFNCNNNMVGYDTLESISEKIKKLGGIVDIETVERDWDEV